MSRALRRPPHLSLAGRIAAVLLLAMGLVGCETAAELADIVADQIHTLEVTNLCGGDNSTVDVYVDDVFQGSVYLRRSFTVISGAHELRAEGRGARGSTFRDAVHVQGDLAWTLCPGRASRSPSGEARHALLAEPDETREHHHA